MYSIKQFINCNKHTVKCFSDCSNPPAKTVGTHNGFVENPPYEANESITYTCPTNYTLYGSDKNICSGPPDYNWTLKEVNLPTCLKSKNCIKFHLCSI